MAHTPFVSPNQKYSAHDDPRKGVHKDDELYPNGKDRPSKDTAHDSSGSSERAQHAVGGVAKHRLGYPDTDGAVGSDRGD